MRSLMVEQAKKLKQGDYIYHIVLRDSRGYPKRYKITSIKTWKTRPECIRVGVKHGLYASYYIDETSIANFSATTEETTTPVVNDPEPDLSEYQMALYKWAAVAVRHLPTEERRRLLLAATEAIQNNGLKGDISDRWRKMDHSQLSIPMMLP